MSIESDYMSTKMAESTFDRVSSMLISLLVFFALVVLVLFGLWLTTGVFSAKAPITVETVPFGNTGYEDDSELDPDVVDPGLDIVMEEPTLLDSLDTITDIVSSKNALFSDSTMFDDNLVPTGKQGDGRTFGTGDGAIGRPRRWEVQFLEGNTIDLYAQQLDSFRIELGVLEPNGTVSYAFGFTQSEPMKRNAKTEDEKRYYLTWKNGELEKADRTLLSKAGIDHEGKLVLKFLSPELENMLSEMEAKHAGSKYNQVRATFFAIRRKGNGFEFYIADQIY